MNYRIEYDSLGEVPVPADALYGAQTQRAIDNFPVSGLRMPRQFIRALGLVKASCARVNADLGLLDAERSAATQTEVSTTITGVAHAVGPDDAGSQPDRCRVGRGRADASAP